MQYRGMIRPSSKILMPVIGRLVFMIKAHIDEYTHKHA